METRAASFSGIESTPEYLAIREFYGARRAERSGVLYINHIDEALRILAWLQADELPKRAFCLHPLFQRDEDLAANWNANVDRLHPRAVLLAVEYRSVANETLSHRPLQSAQEIRLAPLAEVNTMLAADKIQNRKDFELYHLQTHPRSAELQRYFALWLERLGIGETVYQEFKRRLLEPS